MSVMEEMRARLNAFLLEKRSWKLVTEYLEWWFEQWAEAHAAARHAAWCQCMGCKVWSAKRKEYDINVRVVGVEEAKRRANGGSILDPHAPSCRCIICASQKSKSKVFADLFDQLFGDDNKDYATLGVEPGATQAEIKAAYRLKAMELHPDKHLGADKKKIEGLSERFDAVVAAYKRLYKK